MTLETTANRDRFEGSGSPGPFSFDFRFFANSEIVVTLTDTNGDDTVLAEVTDYTLTGARSYNGGAVTLEYDLEVGEVLTVERILPYTQPEDLKNQGAFFPEVHEDAFDRIVMLIQQIADFFVRVPALPASSDVENPGLPIPGAGLWIKWNAAGTALEAVPLPAVFANADFDFGDAAPVAGSYRKGFTRINTAPELGGNWAWVNLAEGGCNFKPFGAISLE